MWDDNFSNLMIGLIPQTYVNQAKDAHHTLQNKINHLLRQRKLPEKGWMEDEIEIFLRGISAMDSNNFLSNCGVGEREGRIYSGIVRRRHFGLSHGIGRSGDLCEVQPKAAGSSLVNRLANALALDALRLCGIPSCAAAFVVPCATGMSIMLCLLSLKRLRPNAKYVIWSRIDQKSCFKSIISSGYIPIILELHRQGDELSTDLKSLEEQLAATENLVAAVITCTSCFAPRVSDDINSVSQLCRKYNIPHIVNNAYGVQSIKLMNKINAAHRCGGRIDVFVQSTDKNFMVPVGGAIIAGFDENVIMSISKMYPGRASSVASLDLLITLLNLGSKGLKKLFEERTENFVYLRQSLETVASKFNFKVFQTKNNPISLAMTLDSVDIKVSNSVTSIGSMLFLRNISGARVISGMDEKNIGGFVFKGWGSHTDESGSPYLTAAAAIGITKNDIDFFVKRLVKIFTKVQTQCTIMQ